MRKTAAMKRYYTLVRRGDDGAWRIEFGDYDRETADFERQDYRDHGIKASNLKILTTSDRQADIDQAVTQLNQMN